MRLRLACLAIFWLGLVVRLSFGGGSSEPSPVRVAMPGLHNVLLLRDGLYSGSAPHGDEGFHSLERLRIKTIVSVDGAKPDLERARRYGMRYVHVPIGYAGISQGAALQLAKVMRELPGPVYVHCHHGKHRGPAAAAIALMCADDRCSTSQALAVLEVAGTDPRYKNLVRSVREFKRPQDREVAAVGPLPETVAATGIVEAMVALDHSWDNMRLVEEANWQMPREHPDIDPAHEALQIVEGYQELRRLTEGTKRPTDFVRWLDDGRAAAQELERSLRSLGGKRPVDPTAVSQIYHRISETCTRCHDKYRDTP